MKQVENTLLVIEDEETIREMLKLALEFQGYTVHTAANGEEGLDALRRIPRPCVILLDLMMPIMNGWEFINAVKQDTTLKGIPIVVVTAFAERGETVKTEQIINKPVNLEVLFEVVGRYCS